MFAALVLNQFDGQNGDVGETIEWVADETIFSLWCKVLLGSARRDVDDTSVAIGIDGSSYGWGSMSVSDAN